MIITLTSGTEVEIKNINISQGTVDWRRTTSGYLGDCMSVVSVTSRITAEAEIKAALDAEGI